MITCAVGVLIKARETGTRVTSPGVCAHSVVTTHEPGGIVH